MIGLSIVGTAISTSARVRAICSSVASGSNRRRIELGGLEHRLEFLVVDGRTHSLARQHVCELGTGEVGVERDEVASESRYRGRRLNEAAVVAAHDRHPPAGAELEVPMQTAGERGC